MSGLWASTTDVAVVPERITGRGVVQLSRDNAIVFPEEGVLVLKPGYTAFIRGFSSVHQHSAGVVSTFPSNFITADCSFSRYIHGSTRYIYEDEYMTWHTGKANFYTCKSTPEPVTS